MPVSVTPTQLPEVLLNVAVVRPVMIWGPPGIGKSALVEAFAHSLGLPCHTLLGTQLAPEDLIGVPRITETEQGPRSEFAPPLMIARSEPYVLFLDELNGSSAEVQKAFYSLIHDRRLGSYELPPETIVIAAGNRAEDMAVVKPMSSALANRLVHVTLVPSAREWLAWAEAAGLHQLVIDYVRQRPDHVFVTPPKTQEPFSTPRSWHLLSDSLISWDKAHEAGAPEWAVAALAYGTLSPTHAAGFTAYARLRTHSWDLDKIVKGELRWPGTPEDRQLLFFLAESLRARLVKELPATKKGGSAASVTFAHRSIELLVQLAEVSAEMARVVIAPDADGKPVLPGWYLNDLIRQVPSLAAARAGNS